MEPEGSLPNSAYSGRITRHPEVERSGVKLTDNGLSRRSLGVDGLIPDAGSILG
jgi:hypothetical protein